MLVTNALFAQGVAVVELFTSQGCSSCPPADRNLSAIIERAKLEDKEVYALSFHVDYWNHLGWRDPYSDKGYTARQRMYASTLHLASLYTPQMIVNGSIEFVGSNQLASREAITKALDTKAVYRLTLSDIGVTNGKLKVHYSLNQRPSGERLNVAIVEKNIENGVSRGENSGRKLHHSNVVRVFSTLPLKKEDDVEVALVDIIPEECQLIVYIQNDQMEVLGAASSPL